MELHAVELDGAATGDFERLRAGLVSYLGVLCEHVHHALDVGQRLPDFAVDGAHEVERDEQLQHQRVDHDELADGVGAAHDVACAHDHAGGERDREDDRLSGVEDCERRVGLDAGRLEQRHRFVIALRLALLGTKVFHRLVVEQAVDGLGVGFSVAVVHGFADGDAPFGGFDCEPEIARDHGDDDGGVAPIEFKQRDCKYK